MAAFPFVFLEGKTLNLFHVCFYFTHWPCNRYLVSLCWFFFPKCHLLNSHPGPHFPLTTFCCTQHPPESTVRKTSHRLFIANPENTSEASHSLRFQQDLTLQTTTFPWAILPLNFNNVIFRAFLWLLCSFSVNFSGFFPLCLLFNIILWAVA